MASIRPQWAQKVGVATRTASKRCVRPLNARGRAAASAAAGEGASVGLPTGGSVGLPAAGAAVAAAAAAAAGAGGAATAALSGDGSDKVPGVVTWAGMSASVHLDVTPSWQRRWHAQLQSGRGTLRQSQYARMLLCIPHPRLCVGTYAGTGSRRPRKGGRRTRHT
jgi:hypothetical protein